MGTYYDVYAEARFNGVWINIDSRIIGLDGKICHALNRILSGSWSDLSSVYVSSCFV